MKKLSSLKVGFFLIALFFAAETFAMGSDSPTRTLTKRCRELRDAMQTQDIEKISVFFTEDFKKRYEEDLKDKKFLYQRPRLLTRIFINEKYQPKDLILLEKARFRVVPGANGDMVCKVYDNGEKENPQLHTLEEIRLVEEAGSWKVSEWKLNAGW